MILVNDALLSDIVRKSRKAAALAAKSGLSQDPDSDISDLFSKGVSRGAFLKELSKFSEEKEDEDLL